MRQVKQILILIYVMGILTGCSSLNSDFQCPMKPGVRCESLDQVDRQIDQGRISKNIFSHSESISTNTAVPTFYKSEVSINGLEPLRYGETVMRVWVAPYEDTAGNYHQESDIYTIVKPAHWIDSPLKESAGEE